MEAISTEELVAWLKYSIQLQPKQKWTEEDEENYRNATTIISRQRIHAHNFGMVSYCNRCIDWLISIKERLS